MSSASLPIKAILLKDGVEEGRKEIRRFRVDGSSGERLQIVLARIHALFSLNAATQCALCWRDEDDDLIQFSSEEELSHAVDNMTDDTLRIFVIVTAGTGKNEEPTAPGPEEHPFSSDNPQPGFSFHPTPPPPPPPPPHHHQPHSHCPPPPFPGPWAHGGWKKWKPMGAGGWKGGWKGGMFFGCPWNMRQDYGCGWKGRGMFKHKHGWDRKLKKKMMKTKRCWTAANSAADQRELREAEQQVPEGFRQWVSQYVATWSALGAEAAACTLTSPLPSTVGPDFPQWLRSFLAQHCPHPCVWGEGEGQEGSAPQCLPPAYFRWLCLFLRHFFRQGAFNLGGASDGEEDKGQGRWESHCQEFCPGAGRQGCCKRRKGGKHRRHMSCDSDDSADSWQKGLGKVPKGFRKFVRMSFKKLRKGKGDNPKIKEKATRAGVSTEVQEFVEQILLEWRAKLTAKDHRAVAKEMMEGERTLPPGLQREHFHWLVRFLGRWRDWRGGKGGAGQNGPSDESSTDTSADEATAEDQDSCSFPPCPSPFMGMMPPPLFPMHPGADHPPFPPHPHMFGCFPPPPPPPPMFAPPAYTFECPRQEEQAKKAPASEVMVEEVTEGVKKL